MHNYNNNKRRGVSTVAPLTVHCGLEQCTPEIGPRARGEEGLAGGVIFGFSRLIFYFFLNILV